LVTGSNPVAGAQKVDARSRVSQRRENGAQTVGFSPKDGSSEVRNSEAVVFRLLQNFRKFPMPDWREKTDEYGTIDDLVFIVKVSDASKSLFETEIVNDGDDSWTYNKPSDDFLLKGDLLDVKKP